jgi:hypothetical protein
MIVISRGSNGGGIVGLRVGTTLVESFGTKP